MEHSKDPIITENQIRSNLSFIFKDFRNLFL